MVGSNEGQILCAVARLNAAEQVKVLLSATMRLPAAFMVAFWSGRPSTFFKAAIDVSGRAEGGAVGRADRDDRADAGTFKVFLASYLGARGVRGMRYVLTAFGTAALIIFTVPAVHASSVDAAAQSLADGQVAYAKKGGWHGGGKGWKHSWKGGRRWGHHRGWRRGPPPWAPAWGWRRKHGRW